MKLLKLKPCDSTFFREDGKSFNVGEDNTFRSKNVPYPSVFFGAIFTALLSKNDSLRKQFLEKHKDNKEDDDRWKILNIGQVYLYNEVTNTAYIPAPKDLFIDTLEKVKYGEVKDIDISFTSLSFEKVLLPPSGEDFKKVSGYYINIEDIYVNYEEKTAFSLELINENKIFKKDYKIGIGLNYDRRMTQDGLLYRIEQTEFESNDWSFIVECDIKSDYIKKEYKEDIKELDFGYLKLGGENKVCKYEVIKNEYIEKFTESFEEVKCYSNCIKVIFTSDVYFKDQEAINKFLKNKVSGIFNDKPIYIGGFDIRKKMPKDMYKGYGAGSIFLIKRNGEEISAIKKELDSLIGDIKAEGFGKYIILEEK